jgi:endonuclease G
MRWALLVICVALLLGIAFGVAVLIRAHQLRPEERSPAPLRAAPAPTGAANPSIEVDDNDPLGLPVSHRRSLQILHKHYFTVGYDNDAKEPAWVSYHLAGPIRFPGHEHRPKKFAEDPDVQAVAYDKDYTGAHLDRGHMCPAYAIFSRFGQEAMGETFITSNIVPQVHGLNAGSWEQLETLIAGRDGAGEGWAGKYGEVWVTDGPIVQNSQRRLPAGEIVPDACFMVVLRKDGSRWSALAFEMPNAPERDPPDAFLVSIRRIEADTGLDLDPGLPQPEQDVLEQAAPRSTWP